MNSEMGARQGAMDHAARSVRRPRRVPRAVTVGLLALATVMGVHLGLDAADVSPVSPPALAARYGPPPGMPEASPTEIAPAPPADAIDLSQAGTPAVAASGAPTAPAEGAAVTATAADRAQADGRQTLSSGRQHGQRGAGRHE